MSLDGVDVMNLEDVLVQASLVLGAMRAVRTTLLRILAALDLQVGLHVSQPAVSVAAFRTREATRPLVEVRSIGMVRIVHDLAQTSDVLLEILILIRPGCCPCKEIKCSG